MGRIDGGRVAQAAYGKGVARVLGLLTYLGLALGVLGGGDLSLSWGLYVLITQGGAEQAPANDVTPVDERRASVAATALVFAVLVLLPLGPPPQP